MSDNGVYREDIEAEKVENLGVDDLIRLFALRLSTFHKEHNLSRSRCVGAVAVEFRDDYKVNILRVLDERGYSHPDGYHWNIGPIPDSTIRKFDPVLPESMQEGGTADLRPGDILKIEDDGLLIIGANDSKFVGMNGSGKIDVHSLATVREVFNDSDIPASLVRNGEIIRGVDAENTGPLSTSTDGGDC